jgi:hypothetical protein
MIKLNDDWMTEGTLDIEYKQYELLAYLQKVEKKFDDLKLYPYFSDIMSHYKGFITYKKNKITLRDAFPKKLVDINLSDTKLKFEDLVEDATYMTQIDQLVDFSLVELRKKISLGKFIYDEVERCVDVLEMGVVQFNSDKGFFIIHDDTIDVYEYELSQLLNTQSSNFLRTKLIRSYPKGLHISYESIRMDLVEGSPFKTPSTFIIDSAIKYPVEETLLPITKRLLVKKLSQH